MVLGISVNQARGLFRQPNHLMEVPDWLLKLTLAYPKLPVEWLLRGQSENALPPEAMLSQPRPGLRLPSRWVAVTVKGLVGLSACFALFLMLGLRQPKLTAPLGHGDDVPLLPRPRLFQEKSGVSDRASPGPEDRTSNLLEPPNLFGPIMPSPP